MAIGKNYTKFSDKIIDIIYRNNELYYNEDMFSVMGNKLGLEIYSLYGPDGLFGVVNLVEQELLYTEYARYLRVLEFSFNGICNEFQA